eukprot:Gregarina_sp_Poly_1__11035@NODE_882_length_5869_cov_169_457601_g631_i0_p2_GENE_NODE_882_length_5869_cov_169_457601_g631_i0NODE_882_length_5869_cov_169_457601_g631_i0_p2_ORF_typecomplete_len630_score74_07CLPTM1/PF05602_12/1_2e35PQloop/PF04193_14/2_6e03PQloop/PF04193_14/4_3e03PQloop/PF04193_14/0_011_NODE_882_length_5869_cov_169_457601_g631_i026564545
MWKTLVGAVAIALWFGNSLRQFYLETTPPFCQPGAPCLSPKAVHGDAYRLHLFITDSLHSRFELAASAPPRLLKAKRHEYLGYLETGFGRERVCGVAQVEASAAGATPLISVVSKSLGKKIVSGGFRKKECVAGIEWVVPESWRSNSTAMHLMGVAVNPKKSNEQLFLSTAQAVSLMYTPEQDRQAETKYLLTGEPGNTFAPASRVTSMSVPKLVRIGPIDIQDDLDLGGLIKKGARQWQVPNTQLYASSLLIDTLASPRDEYMSLLSEEDITITFELASISWRKATLQRLMLNAIDTMEKQFGTSKYESDSLKLLLAGESPLILLATFVVSALHLLFEFLAMSSNWTHFNEATKDRSRSDRVSARSVILDVVFEIAILAWLRDTGEAKIVQYVLIGRIAFNSWKYWKLRSVQGVGETPKSVANLGLWANCKRSLNATELRLMRESLSADAFEAACLRTLTCVLSPLMLGLCLYQLVFVAHKSWVSWLLKSCALTSYVGGFIAMTPQLYKNFYFQSVEHLPWTTLTYQFLNTIIDDLFSLLIRMPQEHRLSVFRDDIVFVIYWIQVRDFTLKQFAAYNRNVTTNAKAFQRGRRRIDHMWGARGHLGSRARWSGGALELNFERKHCTILY